MSVKSFWFLCTSITNTANWEHLSLYQEWTTCSACAAQCTSISGSLLRPFLYLPLQKQTSTTNNLHRWPDSCFQSPQSLKSSLAEPGQVLRKWLRTLPPVLETTIWLMVLSNFTTRHYVATTGPFLVLSTLSFNTDHYKPQLHDSLNS